MRSRARQAGVSLVLLAVVVLIGVVIFIAVKLLERRDDNGTRGLNTDTHFKHARDALISFVAQNERLPCPADPSASTGLAVPAILTISAVVRNWKDLKRKWRLR